MLIYVPFLLVPGPSKSNKVSASLLSSGPKNGPDYMDEEYVDLDWTPETTITTTVPAQEHDHSDLASKSKPNEPPTNKNSFSTETISSSDVGSQIGAQRVDLEGSGSSDEDDEDDDDENIGVENQENGHLGPREVGNGAALEKPEGSGTEKGNSLDEEDDEGSGDYGKYSLKLSGSPTLKTKFVKLAGKSSLERKHWDGLTKTRHKHPTKAKTKKALRVV